MAKLSRKNVIKRPRSKFYTAPNFSLRARWWWAQRDENWRDDADPVPASEIHSSSTEIPLRPAHTLGPIAPGAQYLPGIGTWDDSATWSDNVDWRD